MKELAAYPKYCPDGSALKPLPQALVDHCASPSFKPDAVPEEYLEAILHFGAQAPSGPNLQRWRFLVVRDQENRERLRQAAFDQRKITEAPLVIVAFAMRDDWPDFVDVIFDEGRRREFGELEKISGLKQQAVAFLEKQIRQISQSIRVTRHTMIAVTTMMLVAETYGLETAPLEGFDPVAICRQFGLPERAEVVALLAIGFGHHLDKPAAERRDISEIVHCEHFGRHWNVAGPPSLQLLQ